MECNRPNFGLFLPFYPSNNPENQNFEKMKKKKKTPGDIISLHKCIINNNHMMYSSWDMKHSRHNFFVILGYFLLFYPTNNLKKEIFEKMKKNAWRYHHFTLVYHK